VENVLVRQKLWECHVWTTDCD